MLTPHPQLQRANSRLTGKLIRGHQVASGRSHSSPYPDGSIALQKPVFKQLGLDLSDCYNGTLNLALPVRRFSIARADYHFSQLQWVAGFAPESFSFVRCILAYQGAHYNGWVYYPHPETKTQHFQQPNLIEILAPPIADIRYGQAVTLIYNSEALTLTP